MSCLYILEINPLLVHCLQIFSPSLLVLFMVPFAVQKLLDLIRFHLFIFVFNFHFCKIWSQKNIAVIYVKKCSVFSSRHFTVSSLTFWSENILVLITKPPRTYLSLIIFLYPCLY